MKDIGKRIASLFLKRVDVEVTNATIYEWLGWRIIGQHHGILDQWYSLGVKQMRDGKLVGAWTRVETPIWNNMLEIDQRQLVRLLMDHATELREFTEPQETPTDILYVKDEDGRLVEVSFAVLQS